MEKEPLPTVGMPATWQVGSDSYGGELTYVSPTGHFVMFTHTGYPQAKRFNRCADGVYRGRGGVGRLRLGMAETHLDPSF